MGKLIEGYASVFFSAGDKGSEYQLAQGVVEHIMPGVATARSHRRLKLPRFGITTQTGCWAVVRPARSA